MRTKKLITFILSCLLVLETPLVPQAAELSSALDTAAGTSIQAENPAQAEASVQAENPAQAEASVQAENPAQAEASNPTENSARAEASVQAENPVKAEASVQAENPVTAEVTDNFASSFNVALNHSTANLTAGATLQLTPSFSDYDTGAAANPPQITWSSDHTDIASVSAQGLVTALKAGSATITATAVLDISGNTYTSSSTCTVTVTNAITLNKKKLTLYTCQTSQLNATAVPAGTITWRSSDKAVVTVNSKGKLSPRKAGSATITATANGVSDSCKVTVKTPTLKLDSSQTVYLKNPVTLKATATPKGTVTWKSADKKIAEISSKGKITPKKTGTVKITASCNGVKKTCKITVKKPSAKLTSKNILIFAETDCTIKASAHPSSNLTYRSSNPKVAKVSRNGKITGIHSGTATITAAVPGAASSCEVTVLKNNYKLSRSSQTLMKGSSTTIYMSNTTSYDNVSFEVSDSSVAEIAPSGNTCKVKALKSGTTTLNAYYTLYKDGQSVTCKHSCAIKVIGSGIVQQQAAVAIGADKVLTLKHVDKAGAKITGTSWTSSAPKVATVGSKTGKVKGLKFGSAKITATVSYSDGTAKEYVTSLKVSQPKTTYKHTVVSLGHSQKVALSGLTSYSETAWTLKKKSLVSINPDGTVTAGYKTGSTNLTIKVDGKTIKHTIVVTNPSLKTSYALLAPDGTANIKLSGVSAQSKITYRSRKKSVATVSNTGVVTAHKYGTADIVITADGNSFTFQVEVAPQRAIDARNTGYNIMYSSSYSQARRMSTGYYDCSSLVFRSYGCDTKLLGGIASWAPTAAAMASYLESTGKVISYRGLDVSKLRPGDLIFYRAPYSNGRYKNIYHVSMYYGNGYRLEKPLRPYYPDSNIVMIARPVK